MSDLKEFYEDYIASARQKLAEVISKEEIDYEKRVQEIEQEFNDTAAKKMALDNMAKIRDTSIKNATTLWNKNIAEWQDKLNKLVNQ